MTVLAAFPSCRSSHIHRWLLCCLRMSPLRRGCVLYDWFRFRQCLVHSDPVRCHPTSARNYYGDCCYCCSTEHFAWKRFEKHHLDGRSSTCRSSCTLSFLDHLHLLLLRSTLSAISAATNSRRQTTPCVKVCSFKINTNIGKVHCLPIELFSKEQLKCT